MPILRSTWNRTSGYFRQCCSCYRRKNSNELNEAYPLLPYKDTDKEKFITKNSSPDDENCKDKIESIDHKPLDKPKEVTASPFSDTAVDLSWMHPHNGVDAVTSYKVFYCKEENDSAICLDEATEMDTILTSSTQTTLRIQDPSPGTNYTFRVQAVCDNGTMSVVSNSCGCKTKDAPRPADFVLLQSQLMEKGPPDIYKLPLISGHLDVQGGLRHYRVGEIPPASDLKPEGFLIIVGATDELKNVMLNALANYVLGVEFADLFKFKIATDEELAGQQSVIAYTFCPTILDYTLTVIATPKIEDSESIKSQIRMFVNEQDGPSSPTYSSCRHEFSFTLPCLEPDFMSRVERECVVLESAREEPRRLHGIIRVFNISYEKEVMVRWTHDNWQTSHDTFSAFCSHEGITDRFAFEFPISEDDASFVARYRVAGREYWDNNRGATYNVYSIRSKTQ